MGQSKFQRRMIEETIARFRMIESVEGRALSCPKILGRDGARLSETSSFRKKLGDRSADKDFDRQALVFVFVGRRLPLKMIRIDPANAAYDFDAGLEWTKSVAVGHVQLCTAADLVEKFVKRRLKKHLTKMRAREFEAV